MATNIEWTDATWNPTTGCTRASAGCDNCYAFTMTKRLAAMGQEKYQGLAGKNHFNGVLKTWDDELEKPLRWRKPRMVFVNSMSDLFHKDVPFEFIDKVFAVMAMTPQHTYQILTKRPERMAKYIDRFDIQRLSCAVQLRKPRVRNTDPWGTPWLADVVEPFRKYGHLPNVWLGTSVEDQRQFDIRVPYLCNTPAAIRFLSVEPLLGPIHARFLHLIQWVIIGGESGHNARACNLQWIRDIVEQCDVADVPAYVKQLGAKPYSNADKISHRGADRRLLMEGRKTMSIFHRFLNDKKGGDISEWPEDLRVRQFPQAGARQEATETNPA